jgi:flagellar hook-associated protein 2
VATSTFSVSGLNTGMDTASMVDKLVSLEQQPLTRLQSQQSAFKSQVSQLGAIASKLSALEDAAKALSSGGALAVKATSSNASFAAAPGSGATAGTYAVQVTSLATAAKERSTGFATGATFAAGSLSLSVDGKAYGADQDANGNAVVKWQQGASLTDIAAAIAGSGAPVSATVLFDGQKNYLSITKRDTGYVSDPNAADDGASKALVVSDDLGQLGMAPLKDAGGADVLPRNAKLTIDGLAFTRKSNVISDALPGTTFTLKSAGGAAEDLSLESDVAATQKNLQSFVDAYNGVMSIVQQQLAVSAGSDRTATLAGDGTISGLQRALQSIGVAAVGQGSVRTLADLGVKTQRDGSLTIDASVLSSAVGRDPAAVNALFSDATAGVAKLATQLADTYTAPTTGLLSIRQSGLNTRIRAMDDDAAQMQRRLDAYRQTLLDSFNAMETTVGQYKTIGNFLTQQENALASK